MILECLNTREGGEGEGEGGVGGEREGGGKGEGGRGRGEWRGEGEGGGWGRQVVYFCYIINDVVCSGYTPLEGHSYMFQNRGSMP